MPAYKIKYAPEVLQEIKHIVGYYNSLSAGLGNRFKQNLLAVIKALKNNPNYNSYRYDEVRFAVVDKFPYAVDGTLSKFRLSSLLNKTPTITGLPGFEFYYLQISIKNSPNNIIPYHCWLQNELIDKLLHKRKLKNRRLLNHRF